jgi:hypothetical protein
VIAVADDPREALYARERQDLEAAVVKAVQGQYIGRPPPLLTGWAERTVSAVVSAGWLPPAAVAEKLAGAATRPRFPDLFLAFALGVFVASVLWWPRG